MLKRTIHIMKQKEQQERSVLFKRTDAQPCGEAYNRTRTVLQIFQKPEFSNFVIEFLCKINNSAFIINNKNVRNLVTAPFLVQSVQDWSSCSQSLITQIYKL